jgi:hypothetical protein
MLDWNNAKEAINMNVLQVFSVLEEALALFNELKADGTVQKLQDAEAAIQAELVSNTKLKDLLAKFEPKK